MGSVIRRIRLWCLQESFAPVALFAIAALTVTGHKWVWLDRAVYRLLHRTIALEDALRGVQRPALLAECRAGIRGEFRDGCAVDR